VTSCDFSQLRQSCQTGFQKSSKFSASSKKYQSPKLSGWLFNYVSSTVEFMLLWMRWKDGHACWVNKNFGRRWSWLGLRHYFDFHLKRQANCEELRIAGSPVESVTRCILKTNVELERYRWDIVKVNVKLLSLCLTKHHTMKTYCRSGCDGEE